MTLQFVPSGEFAFHPMLVPHAFKGLGAGPPDAGSLASIAAQGAAVTGGILAGLSAMGALAPEFALAGPIGAAVAGLTAVGLAIANIFSGCGQTCVLASDAANQVGSYLQQNSAWYWGAPTHYYSMQQAALNNIKTAMQTLQQYCGNPQLGSAGQRCISERLVRGGTAPWCPTPDHTGCDYWATFYDPIANDPSVVPDPVPPSGSGSSASSSAADSSGAGIPVPLLIAGGLVALALVMR